MVYEARLVQALEAAPDVDRSQLLGLAATHISGDVPSTIKVATKEELGVLINELGVVLDGPISWDVDDIVRHEGQHERAARSIGCLGVNFGISLYNHDPTSRGVNFVAFLNPYYGQGISSLELAAVAAHPEDPSGGDIAQVKSYGFSGGVLEVVHRAVINNRKGRKHIPIPLSWKGSEDDRSYGLTGLHTANEQLALFSSSSTKA